MSIFIDECGFNIKNNNFRNWIKKITQHNEKLSSKNNRLNLIMALSKHKIIHYSIGENNTNVNIFLTFMKNSVNKMTKDEKNKSLFILDNFTSHLTHELYHFYYNIHLKILFTLPYNLLLI